MIVKIATDILENSWWIEDNVRKVSIKHVLWKDIRFPPPKDVVVQHDDCYEPDYVCVRDNKADDEEVAVLICRMESGEEHSLCFDGRAYLLNDSGKTIDVIHA